MLNLLDVKRIYNIKDYTNLPNFINKGLDNVLENLWEIDNRDGIELYKVNRTIQLLYGLFLNLKQEYFSNDSRISSSMKKYMVNNEISFTIKEDIRNSVNVNNLSLYIPNNVNDKPSLISKNYSIWTDSNSLPYRKNKPAIIGQKNHRFMYIYFNEYNKIMDNKFTPAIQIFNLKTKKIQTKIHYNGNIHCSFGPAVQTLKNTVYLINGNIHRFQLPPIITKEQEIYIDEI